MEEKDGGKTMAGKRWRGKDGGEKMAGKGCRSPTPADASVANDGHEVAPLLNLSAGSIAANRIALSGSEWRSEWRSDVTRREEGKGFSVECDVCV
jgi:hypothetical protein